VDERASRVAKNQSIFRRASEQIEGVVQDLGDSLTVRLIPFLCECADARCTTLIRLTLAEYEGIRAGPKRFAVAAGHEMVSDVERAISRSDRFITVEKVGDAGRIAAEADPR
jgi:hypothetical protein